MNDGNKDLLDLCRLNQIEEKLEDSVISDKEKAETRRAIDWKKRSAVERIERSQPPVSQVVMEKHIAANTTENGVYGLREVVMEGK